MAVSNGRHQPRRSTAALRLLAAPTYGFSGCGEPAVFVVLRDERAIATKAGVYRWYVRHALEHTL